MNFRNIKSIDLLIKRATEIEEEPLEIIDENEDESEFNDPETVERLFKRFNDLEKKYKRKEINLSDFYFYLKFEVENQYDPNIIQKYEEAKIKRKKL